MQTTTPYYYTSYVIAYRNDSGWSFIDFDDPKLKALHIGIVAGTPPADLLVRHDLMAHARPYALQVDTRFESPVHQMLTDIVNKEIDAGLLWGPIAGYYIHHDGLPLKMALIQNEPGAPRMAYHIAMGVRNNEPEWRRRINAAINGRRDEITAILRDYGVPSARRAGPGAATVRSPPAAMRISAPLALAALLLAATAAAQNRWGARATGLSRRRLPRAGAGDGRGRSGNRDRRGRAPVARQARGVRRCAAGAAPPGGPAP